MTRARASSSSGVIADNPRERWLARMRDPDYVPPRFEPALGKPIGSKRWTINGWVEVLEGDEDAAAC